MTALLAHVPFTIVATGALVGVAASLLGVFLVLRRSAMLTDAIAHSIVFGIVIVWLLTRQQAGPVQIVGAAATGVLTVVATEALTRSGKVRNDAAIGLVFPVLFSIGVLLLGLYARDVHIDTHTVLLGEIGFVWLDVVPVAGLEVPRALLWMGVVALVDLTFVALFYKELKLTVFDPALAAALGFAPGALFYALLTLTSGTAVAAFDAVGVVLFLAFAIVPAAAAYLLTDVLWRMLAYAAAIAVASSVAGYAAAVAWNVSIGGMMALATGGFLALAFLFGPRYGLLAQEVRRHGRRANDRNRALLVHLHAHEGTPGAATENAEGALRSHLRWSDARARAVLTRCLRAGLVRREGGMLTLTPEGRRLAREIVAPGALTTPSPARPAPSAPRS